MIRVTIRRQDTNQDEVHEFTLSQITVGRTDRNHVCLPNNRVSSVHARVIENDEGIVLVDNNSTNGTFINGELVRGPVVLSPEDAVDIGVFTLHFERADEGGAVHDGMGGHEPEYDEQPYGEPTFDEMPEPVELGEPPELLGALPEPTPIDPIDARDVPRGPPRGIESVGPAGSGSYRLAVEPEREREPSRPIRATMIEQPLPEPPKSIEEGLELAFRQIREALFGEPTGPQGHARALTAAREVVERVLPGLDPRQRRQWTDWLAREAAGTGPLTDILADEAVSEVLVAGAAYIDVRRGDQRSRHPARFSCEQAVNLALERMVGARTTTAAPIIEGVTDEGVTVHAVGRPIVASGPILVLTRPAGEPASLAQMVERRALSQQAAEVLAAALGRGLNILVCAQTRADPAPLLGALASELAAERRIVAVHRSQVAASLAGRAIVVDGGRDATAALRSAVRMRPDWLFVQDLGGAEAADACAAARRTGGATVASLTADGVEVGLDRLQSILALGAPGSDAPRLRAYVTGCFDLVIAVRRSLAGRDLVAQIAEVRRGGEVVELFAREDDEGALQSTGVAPSLL